MYGCTVHTRKWSPVYDGGEADRTRRGHIETRWVTKVPCLPSIQASGFGRNLPHRSGYHCRVGRVLERSSLTWILPKGSPFSRTLDRSVAITSAVHVTHYVVYLITLAPLSRYSIVCLNFTGDDSLKPLLGLFR